MDAAPEVTVNQDYPSEVVSNELGELMDTPSRVSPGGQSTP